MASPRQMRECPGWRRALVRLVVVAGIGLGGWSSVVAQAAQGHAAPEGPGAVPPAKPAPPPLVLEDKPELLVPKRPRTELDQDRLEALALFSAARLYEQRRDYGRAIQLYQRALRRDPHSAATARSIVALAVRLKRHGEAIRYALKAVEAGESDAMLLQRLGEYLSGLGDWAGAVGLYEKALAAQKASKPTADQVPLWMEMGRLYHLTQQFDKSADNFARVVEALEHPERFGLDDEACQQLLGEPGLGWNLIGESFLLAGRFAPAAAAFQKAHAASPNPGLLSYQLARIDARTGKPEKALQRLQDYFERRLASEGLAPYRLLAELLKALNRQQELVGRLESLHKADPDNVPLGHFLAEKYLEAGQPDKAEALYQALVSKTPTLAGYRNLVQIHRKAGRWEALLKVLGEAVLQIGSLEPLGEQGGPAEDSQWVQNLLETARNRLKADPDSLPYGARMAVAMLAAEAGQYDAAGEFYDLAIQARPEQTARIVLGWGLELLLKEQYDRAAAVFRRGIEQKALPAEDPTLHFYLAGALEMAGRTEEALAAARKAAELAAIGRPGADGAKPARPHQEYPRCLSRVGWVLYHSKRYDEAAKVYKELIQKFGSDYRSDQVRQVVREARLVLSNIAVIQQDTPQAVEWLEQVLDEFPDDPAALNDLGYLWAEQGKHLERAHRMIHQAVEEDPDNGAFRDSLGWVLFQKGRVQEALPELEKAAALEPDPTVFDHLGDAYRKLGQPEKAQDAWRRAAEGFKKSNQMDKLKTVKGKLDALRQAAPEKPR